MRAETPRQLMELWHDAFLRKDTEALAELFEEDAILLCPPQYQLITGRQEIAAQATRVAAIAEITIHNLDILETRDLAICYQTRTLRLAPPHAEPIELTNTTTDVVRRQADGRWLFVIDNPNGTDVTRAR